VVSSSRLQGVAPATGQKLPVTDDPFERRVSGVQSDDVKDSNGSKAGLPNKRFLAAERHSKPAAPKALRSSVTRRSAGRLARDSRQARRPAKAMAAGIDAASMARRCQSPL
jgi:hypothetical protein